VVYLLADCPKLFLFFFFQKKCVTLQKKQMHKVLIVDDETLAREFIAELVALYLPDSVITSI